MEIFTVTQVLSKYQDFSAVRPDRLQAAADRGTNLHAAFAIHALGLWLPDLPADERGYFQSFEGWFKRYVVRVIAVEEKIVDEKLGFSGTLDFVGELAMNGSGEISVIDWKTPVRVGKTWDAQVSAYLHLAKKYKAKSAGCLQLNPGGDTAKLNLVEDPDMAFAAFLSGLNAHRYFLNK